MPTCLPYSHINIHLACEPRRMHGTCGRGYSSCTPVLPVAPVAPVNPVAPVVPDQTKNMGPHANLQEMVGHASA